MFNIIVTGHGGFASGLNQTVQLVMGEQKNMEFIDFVGTIDAKTFSSEFNIKNSGDILILADIKGGTPFNAGVILSEHRAGVRVVGGCNMPMIMQALDVRDSSNLTDAIAQIISTGKEEIGELEIKKRETKSEDGI